MNKLIYIMSLSHSGSTLLNLLLGGHDNIISLGEIFSSFRKAKEQQKICTCGRSVNQCTIWSDVIHHIRSNINWQEKDSYELLLNNVKNVYGPSITIVDSSKSLKDFITLSSYDFGEIYVIYLIKDLRSFSFSQNSRTQKISKNSWKKYFENNSLYTIYWWYTENKKIIHHLNNNNINFIQIGYEELCFKPHKILKKICDFVGVEFTKNILTPENKQSHLIRGNRMRLDKESLSSITYDYRWLINQSYFKNLLFFPFHSFNKENVYSNS